MTSEHWIKIWCNVLFSPQRKVVPSSPKLHTPEFYRSNAVNVPEKSLKIKPTTNRQTRLIYYFIIAAIILHFSACTEDIIRLHAQNKRQMFKNYNIKMYKTAFQSRSRTCFTYS